jgi:hypothetical protein
MASEVVSAKPHEGPLPQRTPARAASDDLFDFPKVEMRLSDAPPAEVSATSARNSAAATAPSEAASGSGARRVRAAAEVRANSSAAETPAAALPGGSPAVRGSLANAASSARASALSQREPSPAAGSDGDGARDASAASEAGRAPRRSFFLRSSSRPARTNRFAPAALLAVLLANIGAWWTLARSAAEVRESVSGLRGELLARATPHKSGAHDASDGSHATDPVSMQDAARSSEAIPGTPAEDAVLANSDELALEVARAEIAAGQWSSARRRLQRLLASVDRIEAPRRETIAMQAEFLCADSYRRAAESAREAGR